MMLILSTQDHAELHAEVYEDRWCIIDAGDNRVLAHRKGYRKAGDALIEAAQAMAQLNGLIEPLPQPPADYRSGIRTEE